MMSLPEVFDALAELNANPPIHVLFATYLEGRYKVKFRKPINPDKPQPQKQGTPAELRLLAKQFGGGRV